MQVLEINVVDDQAIKSMPMETMKEGSSRSKKIHTFHQRQDCIISYWKIISIPKELEYLEILVKVTRRKWNENLKSSNIIRIKGTPTIRMISSNKSHHSKTLYLLVEISNHLMEGLVEKEPPC